LLGLLVILGALGFAIHRWWKRRAIDPNIPLAEPAAVDTRTPEQRALDGLGGLRGGGLPVKEFYDGISDILRTYLEERHGMSAMSKTTRGVIAGLISMNADPKTRAALKTLLKTCDMAKFAKFLPPEPEQDQDIERAKAIVRGLAPVEKKETAGRPT